MIERRTGVWFSVVSAVMIGFGLAYVLFGLRALPVRKAVLLDWESALYGSIMIGWGATLLLVGRIAFREDRQDLKRALLKGLACWLIVEALYSAKLGVWFNVGVDGAVLGLFCAPLLPGTRR